MQVRIIYWEAKRKMAIKNDGVARKYGCFSKEQQEAYNSMPRRQRDYITYRGQGYKKTEAYRMAGYNGASAGQAAYLLETRDARIGDLVNTLLENEKARQLFVTGSELNQKIDLLASQEGDLANIVAEVDNLDHETAKRVAFYRDVMNGKIKTVRVTKRYDGNNNLIEKKIEEVADVNAKFQARKELDRIFGINKIAELGEVKCGDITINIVDASKPKEIVEEEVVVDDGGNGDTKCE